MRVRTVVAPRPGGHFEHSVARLARKYPRVAADVQSENVELTAGEGAFIPTGKRVTLVPGFDGKLIKVRVPSTDQGRGRSGGFRMLLFRVRGEEWKPIILYAKSEAEGLPKSEILRFIREEI